MPRNAPYLLPAALVRLLLPSDAAIWALMREICSLMKSRSFVRAWMVVYEI